MIESFKKWFRREPDPIIHAFLSLKSFRKAPFFDWRFYRKKYSGFNRIGVLTAAVEGGSGGLFINLRIYRSPGKEYLYLLVWSFGDNCTADELLGGTHRTSRAFFENDLPEMLPVIIQSTVAMKAMHEAYLNTMRPNADPVSCQKENI